MQPHEFELLSKNYYWKLENLEGTTFTLCAWCKSNPDYFWYAVGTIEHILGNIKFRCR